MGLPPFRYSNFPSFGNCSNSFQSCIYKSRYPRTPPRSWVSCLGTYRRGILGYPGKSCIHQYHCNDGADELSCGISKDSRMSRNER